MSAALRRALCIGGLIAIAAGSARAETERVRLVYRASPDCPDEAAFVAEVGRRVSEPWLADAAQPARAFNVTLSSDGKQSRGELMYLSARGRPTRRVLNASNCGDVFGAMVLVSVLAIQSGFEAADEPAPRTEATPRPEPAPAAPPAPTPERARRRASSLAVRAAARLLLAGAVGPEPAFGLGSYVELGPSARVWTMHAGFGALGTGSVDVGSGRRAAFELQYVELGACPELAGRSLALVACGLLQVGLLSGRGERTPPLVVNIEEDQVFWLALALEPRIEFRAEFLSLQLAPALILPITRRRFAFESPDATAHRVPYVSWSVGAGVGVQFP